MCIESAVSQRLGSRTELFTIEEGLSQTGVNYLLKDSKGFLWIATQDGLDRYDGYSFTLFRHNPTDSTSICDNFIRHLCEDHNGNIWIATNNGLSYYDPRKGNFKNFYSSSQPNSLSDNSIYNVFEDKSGVIWVKTLESLEKLDTEKESFIQYYHFSNVFNYVSGDFFFDIFEDHYGKLWIGTKDGLNCFDKNLELFERFENNPNDPNSLSNNRVKSIKEDDNGNLWIATDNGLNKFDRIKKIFTRYSTSDGLPSNSVNSITPLADGSLWLGTMNGFCKFFPTTNKINIYYSIPLGNNYLPISGISNIIQDNAGLLWIGSYQGLIKIDLKPFKFGLSRIKMPGFENESAVSSIFCDNNNFLWVGTWGKGLIRQNLSTGVRQYYNSHLKPGIFSDDNIISFYQDKTQNVWIGTGSGLIIYKPKEDRFVNFKSIQKNHAFLENNRIYAICQDANDVMWIGTEHGLHSYKADKNIVNNYIQLLDTDGSQSQTVFSIIQDKSLNIWIGTNRGLIKYNEAQKKIEHYLAKPGSKHSLSSNFVYNLLCSSDSVIWVGTNSGLCRYRPTTNDFDIYSEQEGLPNNLIYALQEDKNKNIWMSTNRGLVCYNVKEEVFTDFDLADGLQSYEFAMGAASKSTKGELFFGGLRGYNFFSPDSLNVRQSIHNIEITSVEIVGQNVKKIVNIWPEKEIRIPAGTNLFSVSFALLDFTYPANNHYVYSIYSSDNDMVWVKNGNKNSVTFSNLPAGNYTFKVKGANSDMVWSQNEYTIYLIVETPIWKTKISILTYIILLFGLGYLTVQWRTRKLRKTNKELVFKELAAIKIAQQKEELTIKNKNITDSINYAKRIQVAMMPSERSFKRVLPNSFVLHKPRDIVSGDFYWMYERNDKIFVAAVDCTGHGVPGAFMSIIGVELFRKITSNDIENPGIILSHLNEEFSKIFSDVEDVSLKDGMDIAFCVINKKANTLEFAGAFNPLYLIRENKLQEIKGNRFSVSMEKKQEELEFITHTVPLQKDDMMYIFSDGYADQFGGYEGKKFKYRRLRHLLLNIHQLPLEDQKKYLDESMESWKGNNEQVDDILIIGIRADF